MGLMSVGGGNPGPFGTVYFVHTWIDFDCDTLYSEDYFSNFRFQDSVKIYFTAEKTFDVVFHITARKDSTNHFMPKIQDIGVDDGDQPITEGQKYTFTKGHNYVIGVIQNSGYARYILYATNK